MGLLWFAAGALCMLGLQALAFPALIRWALTGRLRNRNRRAYARIASPERTTEGDTMNDTTTRQMQAAHIDYAAFRNAARDPDYLRQQSAAMQAAHVAGEPLEYGPAPRWVMPAVVGACLLFWGVAGLGAACLLGWRP